VRGSDTRHRVKWLPAALSDRSAALWLLAVTTGMRRSELASANRDLLDLHPPHLRHAVAG
jgi:integrase